MHHFPLAVGERFFRGEMEGRMEMETERIMRSREMNKGWKGDEQFVLGRIPRTKSCTDLRCWK